MGILDGKVAIVTGAGRGIGAEHAKLLAKEGAKVIVNDLGGDVTAEGKDDRPATQVVEEIRAAGGIAEPNFGDVTNEQDVKGMIEQAIKTYGKLDILVNNAGNLRDKMSFNMEAADWDSVIAVHLRGHFLTSRYAGAYWREQSKTTGQPVNAAILNTSSESGLYGNPGQLNYAAAKAGIASMTIVLARELEKYGVRANAIAPRARTRMTEDLMRARGVTTPTEGFDDRHPANVSPLVCFLVSDLAKDINGQVFVVGGGTVQWMKNWHVQSEINKNGRWEPLELADAVKDLFKGQYTGAPHRNR